MKNILITGGAGFIGSNFIRFALETDSSINIFNLDALTYAGNLENLQNLPDESRYTFIRGDICEEELLDTIFPKYDIDTVVHFAAESHVDRSILGPKDFVNTNIVGTFNLLESARKFWGDNFEGKRFHHVSTDEVFGSLDHSSPSFKETTPYDPRSPYSASKASSDHMVRAYHHTYKLPISISNCSNNYGPYQYPEKFVPVIILNCLAGNSIPIYGDGLQIRDWLYVIDHCEAIWEILQTGKVSETYNIGGDNQPTNIEIVRTICKLMDEKLPESPFSPHDNLITFVTDRPGHDRRYAMDINKINKDLGWKPSEDLASGLRKTVDWYLTNQDWIEVISHREEFQEWDKKNYSHR